jgi:branched-chain amino acid transport system permease protein
MITLALAQMIYFFYLQAPFTHGEDGIQAVPRGQPVRLHRPHQHLRDVLHRAGGVLRRLPADLAPIHSPFGQVLKAIRENEPRAISLGYDTTHYKFQAYVLSATLAGLAGATKAIVFQLASLTDAHWTMSGEVVLMTLLGGLGTIFGPVVGALDHHHDGELPRAPRRVGHHRAGRDLRDLRADLPPRRDRRDRQLLKKPL